MKILWTSNSPMVATGYGKQTRLFTRELLKDGHEVNVFANFGHHGGILEWQGLRILPSGREPYGDDMLAQHYRGLNPDVHVMLFDIWPFDNDVLEEAGVTAYAPVDHDVLPPLVAERLKHTPYQWAMSRHGEAQMKAAGLDPFYVPHMVDCSTFVPAGRAEARRKVKVEDDMFLAVMVAAHKGYPMRKAFDRVLRAWGKFAGAHKKVLLHIHTDPAPARSNTNVDLEQIARLYEVPSNTLRFPDAAKLNTGYFGDEHMNALFNAADVLIAPSMGEGFGVPVVEAQASGCPVIVSDFTAQSELAGPGFKVPIHDDDLFYSLQGAHYCLPRYSEILRGLEWALEKRGDNALRQQCRAFAVDYDVNVVYPRYARPALESQQAMEEETRQPRKWAKLGMWIDGRVWFPAKEPDDTHGRTIGPEGREIIRRNMFPNTVDGIAVKLADDPEGGVVKVVLREIEQTYRLQEIDLSEAAWAIDIGAQVGAVSIYLALKYPNLKIVAFEPLAVNFDRLMTNLRTNGVEERVIAVNKAVTGDGQPVTLHSNIETNSGNASAYSVGAALATVDSVTLADIFETYIPAGERVALLKIDCEGAEYAILTAGEACLERVDALVGEFHTNNALMAQGHEFKALRDLVMRHVGLVNVSPCKIDDVRAGRIA